MSEIDDIFATKGKTKAKEPPSSTPAPKNKKKKSKKDKKSDTSSTKASGEDPPLSNKKRKAPETVVDPSQKIESSTKRQKSSADTKKSKLTKNKEDAAFKDSRGTQGRRTTEEGFAIYKEDELGISHEGGDTALCPFDCDCCF